MRKQVFPRDGAGMLWMNSNDFQNPGPPFIPLDILSCMPLDLAKKMLLYRSLETSKVVTRDFPSLFGGYFRPIGPGHEGVWG